MSADYLRALVRSWRDFDWRARERWLGEHPQFLAEIDDTTVHFAHLRSDRPTAPALLVMHGWPHTFALQLDYADLLPDFHVVVASLPGFAFSTPYEQGPITEVRLAETMHRLMTEVLGYRHYLTYGEDVSANVNDLIAATYPQSVAGILVTHAHFPSTDERARLTGSDERAFFQRLAAAHGTDGAYGHVQATRPDTLAAALNDSPAGLLAWLAEKLVEWSDTPEGAPADLERRIARERILTEAMIYWVTQSIATSFRPYYEGADTPGAHSARHRAGGRVHPAARVRLPRVARAGLLSRSAHVRAARRGRPFRGRRGPRCHGRAHARVRARSSACSEGSAQAARPRRSSSGWMSASRPRKSR